MASGPLGIALGVGGFALQIGLSFLNRNKGGSEIGKIAEFRLQKSDFGSDIVTFDGMFRGSGAIVAAGPVTEYVKDTRTGKGFSGPKQFEYNYTQSVQHLFAFTDAAGIGGIVKIFSGSDQQPIFDATAVDGVRAKIDGNRIITDSMTIYLGQEGQPPDPTLIEIFGADKVNALGRCVHVVLKDYPRDQQMPALSAIMSQEPLANAYPFVALPQAIEHTGQATALTADGQFAITKFGDRLFVYNLPGKVLQLTVDIPRGGGFMPPGLTSNNDALWIKGRRDLGQSTYSLFLRTWPNYAASSQTEVIVPGSGLGTDGQGMTTMSKFDSFGSPQEFVMVSTNSVVRVYSVDPDLLLPLIVEVDLPWSEVYPEGGLSHDVYPLTNNGEDKFYATTVVPGLTQMRITEIDPRFNLLGPTWLVSLGTTVAFDFRGTSHATFDPVTGKLLFIARRVSDDRGLVFRWGIGDSSMETLVLSGDIDMEDSMGSWMAGPNGENHIYVVRDANAVYEIDVVALTERRVIDLTNWPVSVLDGVMFDANNHALLAFDRPTTWFALLDRIDAASAQIPIATMVTRRHGHTEKLTPAQLDVTGLTGQYTGSMMRGGQTIANYIAAVQELTGFDVREDQAGGVAKVFYFDKGGAIDATIPLEDLGARAAGQRRPDVLAFEDAGDDDLPSSLELTIPEAAIDFNNGYSLHTRSPEAFSGLDRKSLSSQHVALTAAARGAAVERLLFEAHAMQTPLTISLTQKWSWLRPKRRVAIIGKTATFRAVIMEGQRGTAGVIRFKVRTEAIEAFDTSDIEPVLLGDRSRPVASLQPLAVAIADAPAPTDALTHPQGPPAVFVLVSRFSEAGRFVGAPVLRRQADGSYKEETRIGPQGEVQGYGFLQQALSGDVDPNVFDEDSILEIQLYRGTITSAPLSEVVGSPTKNLVLVRSDDGAWEWLQYTTMALQGDNLWISTGPLIRGRRNTANHMGHNKGAEAWVVTGAQGAEAVYSMAEIGLEIAYKVPPNGLEPSLSPALPITPVGRSIMPYAPDPITGVREGNDDWTISFWFVPIEGSGDILGIIPNTLGQFRFRVKVLDGPRGTVVNTYDSDTVPGDFTLDSADNPQVFLYTAANQTTDFGAVQGDIHVAIVMIGEGDIEGEPAYQSMDDSTPVTMLQSKAGSATGDVVTVTLDSPATAGNRICLIHCIVTDALFLTTGVTDPADFVQLLGSVAGDNQIRVLAKVAAGGETVFTCTLAPFRTDYNQALYAIEYEGAGGTNPLTAADVIQSETLTQVGSGPTLAMAEIQPRQKHALFIAAASFANAGQLAAFSVSWSADFTEIGEEYTDPGSFDDAQRSSVAVFTTALGEAKAATATMTANANELSNGRLIAVK